MMPLGTDGSAHSTSMVVGEMALRRGRVGAEGAVCVWGVGVQWYAVPCLNADLLSHTENVNLISDQGYRMRSNGS